MVKLSFSLSELWAKNLKSGIEPPRPDRIGSIIVLAYTSVLLQPVMILLYKTCFLFLSDVAADETVSDEKANPLEEENSLPKGICLTFNYVHDIFIHENMMLQLKQQKIMVKCHGLQHCLGSFSHSKTKHKFQRVDD